MYPDSTIRYYVRPAAGVAMKSESHSPMRIITAGLMISGNTIGAGILGLPILSGMAGSLPAVSGLIVIWFLMLASGYILARAMTGHGKDIKGLPSLYQTELGTVGKGVATVGYLINYFGILVAYLCGATVTITHLIHTQIPDLVVTLIFFAVFTAITIFGVEAVRKSNAFLMLLLFVAFLFLLFSAAKNINMEWLTYTDWRYFPATFPIFIVSFTYHNTIPIVVRTLDYDRRAVDKALILGTTIPLLVSLLWILAVIGCLPLTGSGQSEETIYYAFQNNLPATVPLAKILHSELFTVFGLIFTVLAISTSYLAVGIGLLNFMKDLTSPIFKGRNLLTDALFAFALPLLITIFYPDLFLTALNVAGGVGVGIVFGILPGIILFKRGRSNKMILLLGTGIILFFVLVMGMELLQEMNLLKIKPHIESWTSTFNH
jgi:tyrosine-specific transport protein